VILAFCSNGCILTEAGTDKNHPGQNLPDKKLRTRPLVKNLRELRQTPCKDTCMYSVCMYMYVSSFNDIMMTNRNMVQYRMDKRYDC